MAYKDPSRRKTPRGKPARADGTEVRVHFTLAVAREICVRLARGERWIDICNTGRLPAKATLKNWRWRYPVFAEAVAQAREVARDGVGDGPLPAIFDHPQLGRRARPDEDERPHRKRRPPWSRRRGRDDKGRQVMVRYSRKVAEAICQGLIEGKMWKEICGGPRQPTYGAVQYWRKTRPEFDAAVAAVLPLAAEARFERALEVAHAATPATVQADKLFVAILLRHAETMDRERFSLRAPRHGGPADEPVRMITIRRFEKALDENGNTYVRAIDAVQEVR